jgi:TIR domain
MAPSPTRTKVFISYSHKDQEWLYRLQTHLKPLVREGLDCWDDTHIRPGDDWKQEIQNALDTAQIAVLLISANFFASDFIELMRMNFRHCSPPPKPKGSVSCR